MTRRRAGASFSAEARQRIARRSKRRTSRSTSLSARVRRRRRDALGVVVEREHGLVAELRGRDREHPRAGADVEQARRRAPRRRRARAAARGTGGWSRAPPVPNAWPGSITISCSIRPGPLAGGSHGGRTRSAGTRRDAGAGAGIRTGRWNSLPALLPVVGDLARRDLDERLADDGAQVGQAGQLSRGSVDGVLDSRSSSSTSSTPAGASSSSSASTSSACSRGTRTARRITRPGCRARGAAWRRPTPASGGSPR